MIQFRIKNNHVLSTFFFTPKFPQRSIYHGDLSYLHKPGLQPLVYMTLGQLSDRGRELFGDRVFLQSQHQGLKMSFNQLSEQTDGMAAGLLGIGLQQGDRIGIFGTNSIQWILSAIAAAKAGLISVNINPASQLPELRHCIESVNIRALIIDERYKEHDFVALVQRIIKEKPLKAIIVNSENNYTRMLKFSDIFRAVNKESQNKIIEMKKTIQSDDGCNIQFTSGTTGSPKGTLLTHHGMVNNCISLGRRFGFDQKDLSICMSVPLFHCYGFVVALMNALYYGIPVIMPSATFSARHTIDAIKKERLSIIFGTPTMYVDILDLIKTTGEKIDSLKYAITAGSLCSPQLFLAMKEQLKVENIKSCYGMTETSPVSFCSLPGESMTDTIETVGSLMDHLEAKVVDSDGKLVPFGNPGELLMRGYSNMLGYWKNENASKSTIRGDRWLKTGDQFILRKDGYGMIVGRIKDIIIRGGENIFPKELEEFLETHPDIMEAQVFGISDRRLGESVCAMIRVHKDSKLTEDEIRNYCKGKISHFKIPQHIRIRGSFPLTLSGKIKKYELKNELEKELLLSNY